MLSLRWRLDGERSLWSRGYENGGAEVVSCLFHVIIHDEWN